MIRDLRVSFVSNYLRRVVYSNEHPAYTSSRLAGIAHIYGGAAVALGAGTSTRL